MNVHMPSIHDRVGRLHWHRSVGTFAHSLDTAVHEITRRVDAIEREASGADQVHSWLVAQASQALPELALLDALLASVDANHQTNATEIARLRAQWAALHRTFNATAEQCRAAAQTLTNQTQQLARRLEQQRAAVDLPLCEQFIRKTSQIGYYVNASASCSVCRADDIPFCVTFARQCSQAEPTPALRCAGHECRCDFFEPSGLVCLQCALRHLYHGAGDGRRSFVQCMRCNAQVCIHDLKLFRVTKRASPRLARRDSAEAS